MAAAFAALAGAVIVRRWLPSERIGGTAQEAHTKLSTAIAVEGQAA